MSSSQHPPLKKGDWSPSQYLKFIHERTRPVHDLLSQTIPLINTKHPLIYDLGCGPGNSTKVLIDAFPSATITGIDSSPDMLRKASSDSSLSNVEFREGDVRTFVLDTAGADLLFSNAVFHWLRRSERIATIIRLFTSLDAGGVLAFQVPDNYDEPSHALMRQTASLPSKPWSSSFSSVSIGDLTDGARPDLDPIESASAFYNALSPLASGVNVWRTTYHHVLPDAGAIVEWVKGTGLQPFLQRIEDEGVEGEFLEEYERRVGGEYGELVDGRVLLGYPRLFVVAVRK